MMMARRENNDDDKPPTISPNTKVSLAVIATIAPFVVWAARADHRIEQLEADRAEVKRDIRDLNYKMDELLSIARQARDGTLPRR